MFQKLINISPLNTKINLNYS